MNKKGVKIIASMLVFVMMFTYMSIVEEVIATSVTSTQSTQTNNANVEFDAYMMEDTNKKYAAIKKIGEQNYLYAKVTVKNEGYLKGGTISVDNPNFKIVENGIQSESVSKVELNKISLNQIKKGNTVEIAIPIQMQEAETINTSEFNKQNTINFVGTYVDGNGKEKEVKNDITVALGWTQEKKAELDVQLTKLIPYTSAEGNGNILQMVVKSNLKDNLLPVKQDKIEITVPQIKETKPQNVKVVANTTKGTNGDETGINFTTDNYTYNQETGILTIEVNNTENTDGKVSWMKNANDEFIISFIYSSEVTAGTTAPYSVKSTLTLVDTSETHASKTITKEEPLATLPGDVVEFTLNTNVEQLSKGQIYANYDATKKVETIYEENVTANITYASLIDSVTIEQDADNFVKADGKTKASTTVSGNNYAYYKQFVIAKTNFDKILREEGSINIYNGTTLIATINKDTTPDENQNLVVDLSQFNINNIKVVSSKPVTEGKLEVKLQKAIKADIGYTIAQMKDFASLELNTTAKTTNNVTIAGTDKNLNKVINFVEPTTEAELTIDNTNLSTVVTNKNVKITAALKTDSLNCKLYKNPTLKITLPNYIENIDIKNVEVLFETEGTKLTLENYKIVPNADGTKTIEVTLQGTQTEYTIGSVSKGLNVVITSDLTVNKLTPNKQEQVTMNYTNNNQVAEEKQTSAAINFVAPTGIVTISSVSNYVENAETVTAISGEEKTATINTMVEARNAKFEMNLINNYSNSIDNISILGRTLFEGNKAINTGLNLGSTMTMPLASAIAVSGIDASKVAVYYSENGDATKDLSLASNKWTLTPANLANVRSYLIVLTDYTMNTGNGISFAYDATIPANLQHNQSAFENYVAYFNNNVPTGAIQDKAVSTKMGVTTGRGPVIETTLKSDVDENTEVQTGKFIKYTLKVANTGTEKAENVVATVNVPTGLDYMEEDSQTSSGYKMVASGGTTADINIGNIEAGKTVEKTLIMKASIITEDTLKTETKVTVTSSSITGPIETNLVKNTVVKTYFLTSVNIQNIKKIISENDEYTYDFLVLSSSIVDKRDETVLEVNIPQEVTYEEVKVYDKGDKEDTEITNSTTNKYDKNSRKLTVNLGTVNGMNSKKISVKVKVNKLPENTYSSKVNLNATVSGKNVRAQSITAPETEIGKIGLKINQTSTITENAQINAYEDYKYIFTIENLSNIDINDLKVTDMLPDGLEFSSIEVIYNNGSKRTSYQKNEDGSVTLDKIMLTAKNKITVEVNVIAKGLEKDTEITNYAKVECNGMETINSNNIVNTILKYEEKKSEEVDKELKRLSGQVWKDENNDGIKDEKETRLSNVEVMLFNNETGKLVTDSNGNIIKEHTADNGTYTFSNVEKGKYTVIFLYDTANYSATAYRKENVDNTKNSDAVDAKITLDGISRVAAITEEIIVSDNIYNIDLGLITNAKFDLTLNKTVSKITVQDSKGTNEYDCKDTKLAKRDLVGKNVNDTTIIVEYKIAVTNEGAVPGYVKKIVDYMPSEMKFSSELNRDWYTSSNGAIYNSSLSNTVINPGETKEVTLTLTKKMTEESLGLINNTAEIYEAYNDLGLEDVDSTVANKLSNEDDMSSADVLITVKTGEVVLFIGISITAIAIIAVGAYFIKKKVLR